MSYRRNRVRNPRLADNGDYYVGMPSSGSTVSSSIVDLAGVGQPLPTLQYVWQTSIATVTGSPNYIDTWYTNGTAGNLEIPVAPGEHVTAAAYIRGFASVAIAAQLFVQFLDAAGAIIGTSAGGTGTASVSTTSGTWVHPYLVDAVAPSGTVRARMVMRVTTGSVFVVGNRMQVTGLQFEAGPAAIPLQDYFDGSVPGPLTVWDGAEDASTSSQWAPVIATTVFNDGDAGVEQQPRVQLVVSDLPTPRGGLLILRAIVDGEVDRIVRDANMAEYAGPFVVEDVEAPIGVPITYRVEVYDPDSTYLGTGPNSGLATIPIIDRLRVYIHDPLDPTTWTRGLLDADALDEIGVTRDGSFETPGGVVDGAVLLAGGYSGLTGLKLDFYSEDRTHSRAFLDVQRQTPIAVVRICAPIDDVPKTLYVALLDPRRRVLDQNDGFAKWTWTTRQVLSPRASVVVPLHSYADYIAFYPTYADAMAVFSAYVDAILNPPPAV